MVRTILIPREAVPKFLALKLHIKSDWNKKLRLVGILMYCCRIKVIITRIQHRTKLIKCTALLAKLHKMTINFMKVLELSHDHSKQVLYVCVCVEIVQISYVVWKGPVWILLTVQDWSWWFCYLGNTLSVHYVSRKCNPIIS